MNNTIFNINNSEKGYSLLDNKGKKKISNNHEPHNLLYHKLTFFLILLFFNFAQLNTELIPKNDFVSLFEKDQNFSSYSTDIKVIALYLPQFHAIKENNEWWGEGFTEWTNVKKSKPRFINHNQPRQPLEQPDYIGYYNLTIIEHIKKQVELANEHGIYGFGIYYYWFSGKRLLEKPLDIILEHKEIIIKFLLIWANENWTRTWDGFEKYILIEQKYNKDDPINFIKDIKKYLMDERYIKINQKKVIGLYEPKKIPNLSEAMRIWREKSREFGIGEIFILVTQKRYNYTKVKEQNLFDGLYQFPPLDLDLFFIYGSGYRLYTQLFSNEVNEKDISQDFPLFRGSMLEWDNSARREEFWVFAHYSPEYFYIRNRQLVNWSRKVYNESNRYIFINAWNEWGEGAYLEPDNKYGFSSLNALSKAIFDLPYIKEPNLSFLNKTCLIAIHAFITKVDSIEEIIKKINNVNFKYDLFISIDSNIETYIIQNYIKNYSKAQQYIIISSNKDYTGFIPLINILKNYTKKYKYFCNINDLELNYDNEINIETKQYLYGNLLGSQYIVSQILSDFENNSKLGLIYPEPYYKILLRYGIKFRKKTDNLLAKVFPKYKFYHECDLIGNMFWAKFEAISKIFEMNFHDLLSQKKQIQTEYIQKFWIYLIEYNNFVYKKILKYPDVHNH